MIFWFFNLTWIYWVCSQKHFTQHNIRNSIIGTKFICTIDETNAIADQSLYVAVPFEESKTDLHSFLAVLNSKLYGFFFRKFYSEEDDLFPKIKVNELKRLPYKPPNKEIENRLIELARKIISLKKENQVTNVSDLENEIDQLVYQLYGLTEEEIAIIESA